MLKMMMVIDNDGQEKQSVLPNDVKCTCVCYNAAVIVAETILVMYQRFVSGTEVATVMGPSEEDDEAALDKLATEHETAEGRPSQFPGSETAEFEAKVVRIGTSIVVVAADTPNCCCCWSCCCVGVDDGRPGETVRELDTGR